MESEIHNIRRILPEDFPDGEWLGIWSGYTVRFSCPDGHYEATTDNGVRGIDIECIVRVTHGYATVRTR